MIKQPMEGHTNSMEQNQELNPVLLFLKFMIFPIFLCFAGQG